MHYSLGIDIGSGFSKAVVCADRVVLSSAVIPSGGSYKQAAAAVAEAALGKAGLSAAAVSFTTATGYGAGAVDFADQSVTDISCHASGVHHLFPSAKTVVDIGAQFSKAISVDGSGRITNFILNEKCAGGSGRFLQVIARILHIEVEEIGELSMASKNPVEFTTGCAVFAESEAVSRIAEGALPADILAGVHKAMASKIVNLVTRVGLTRDIVITGGGARDIGLVKTIEAELGTDVLVPEQPQITAALGAALMDANGAGPNRR
ncbi:MAG: acyl-CoA dehydratase activase [Syntrophorhabdales bacterium]|jgi:predicted CoA-substrate-specific enzyme activase